MNHTNGARARKYSAISFAVVGAFLVVGCSSTPKDPTTSPPETAPTASTTMVATTAPPPTTPAVYKPATDQGPAENVPVPVLPEKAKELSKEGLIAFTEYWYSTLGYAFETGDTKPMMDSTGTDCPSCMAMKEAVEPWHSEGRWIVGGQMQVLGTDTSFVSLSDGTYQSIAMVMQTKVMYFHGNGTLAVDKGQKRATGDLMVARYDAGHWTAVNVSHLEGSKK